MATLSRIRVHPIKALEPEEPAAVHVSEVGGLEDDRSYAVVDADGDYVNGKRTAAVHRLRTSFDPNDGAVEIGVAGSDDRRRFDLDDDRGALADWLSAYFGFEVELEAAPGGELADSRVYGDAVAGATIVSAETLRTVASWFPDPEIDADDVRRRFRANLEVDGVEAFWEDRLVGGEETDASRLRVGDVTFEAVEPIPRCVVPTRDPDSGEATEGFRERFLEKREEHFPDDADRSAFDHLYALTTLAHPAEPDRGKPIRRGDPVELLD